MPAKSKEQAKLMKAACNSKQFAKKVGIPQSQACEFVNAKKVPKGKKK
jgi:hypothetical protein